MHDAIDPSNVDGNSYFDIDIAIDAVQRLSVFLYDKSWILEFHLNLQ